MTESIIAKIINGWPLAGEFTHREKHLCHMQILVPK